MTAMNPLNLHVRAGDCMSVLKSNFTVRISNNLQEAVRAQSKKTGESINSIAERWLIKGKRSENRLTHEDN